MRFLLALSCVVSSLACGLAAGAQTSARGLDVEVTGSKETKWAIVIGLNYYQDNSIGSLDYAVPDALLIKDVLIEGGFKPDHVRLICDIQDDPALKPNAYNLLNRLTEWLQLAGSDDTVFVFFSGHGFLDSDGQGFLAPSDCDLSKLAESSVSMKAVNESLTNCKARRKLLLLDCCRNLRGKGTAGGISSEELARSFEASEGLITIASCRQEQKSYESEELKHGFFTWYVAEAMQGHADASSDGIVDSSELYTYVWQRVMHAATLNHKDQSPVEIKQEVSGVFAVVNVPAVPGIIPSRYEGDKNELPDVAESVLPAAQTNAIPAASRMSLWLFAGLPLAIVLVAVFIFRPKQRQPKTVISAGGRQRSRIAPDE